MSLNSNFTVFKLSRRGFMMCDIQIDDLLNNVQQGLNPDDFKWFSENVQLKIDLISNQENEIIVLLNSLEQNYDERYFKDIVYYLNSNLDTVCQLNDNIILQQFISCYKDKFIVKFQEAYQSLGDSIYKNQFIEFKTIFYTELDFWECIVNYWLYFENEAIIPFTPTYAFNFYFTKISNFMKLLQKEQLQHYYQYLKFLYATKNIAINPFEFDFKLKYLVEYYSETDRIGWGSLTRNNMLKIAYEAFLKIGLKSDFNNFEKASKKGRVILNFQKSETLNYETSFVYVIGAMISRLEDNTRISDFDFSQLSIQINDKEQKKIKPYKEIMELKNKYMKKISEEENFEEYLKNKFEYYRKYENALNNLYLFRNSIII